MRSIKVLTTFLAGLLLFGSSSVFAENAKPIEQQKISIQKVVSNESDRLSGGQEIKSLKGVNGANFKVYDISNLMTQELEKLQKTSEKSSSSSASKSSEATTQSSEAVTKSSETISSTQTASTEAVNSEFTERSDDSTSESVSSEESSTEKVIQSDEFITQLKILAGQTDLSKLQVVAQGTTQTSDQKDGIFEFTVPVKSKTYQAYYIVNDSVKDDSATLSEPFVLITPQLDDEGSILNTVYVYPKAQLKETTPDIVKEVKLPNTGIKADFISKIINIFN